MTLKRAAPETMSSRARAFCVEALIGKRSKRDTEVSFVDEDEDDRKNSALKDEERFCDRAVDRTDGSGRSVHCSGNTDVFSSDPSAGIGEGVGWATNGGPKADGKKSAFTAENVNVDLCSKELWRKFHSLGTEMIITKAGRRMFPTVKVRISGLDPDASYILFLDVVPMDDKRYRYVYHSSQWMVAGPGDPPSASPSHSRSTTSPTPSHPRSSSHPPSSSPPLYPSSSSTSIPSPECPESSSAPTTISSPSPSVATTTSSSPSPSATAGTTRFFVHPDSPAPGQLWMAQGVVSFDKLKLTNNRRPLVRGQVSLHSMHKYVPRVHILRTDDLDTPVDVQAMEALEAEGRLEEEESGRTGKSATPVGDKTSKRNPQMRLKRLRRIRRRHSIFSFPETTFTTVTAYQNQQITRLKIASNPFAKGFREASRNRDVLEECRQRPMVFPSPPPPFSLNCGQYPDVQHRLQIPPPSVPGFPSPSEYQYYYSRFPLTMPIKFIVPPQGAGSYEANIRHDHGSGLYGDVPLDGWSPPQPIMHPLAIHNVSPSSHCMMNSISPYGHIPSDVIDLSKLK